MKRLYCAIGIDCDPDRDVYPTKLAWRGVENIGKLYEIPEVKWTFNIRADSQVKDFHGSAAYCYNNYRAIWDEAVERGHALALHLHYFGKDWKQDISEANIVENIKLGVEALDNPDLIHMGWTFQNDFSIQKLGEAGIKVDYSPLPKLKFDGRNGTDAYDWSNFEYEPSLWHKVKMIPAYTYEDKLLSKRFGTERVMLTTTTTPLLYNDC